MNLNDAKQKLAAILQTPQEARKGTTGYLIDKWHKTNGLRQRMESIVTKLRHDLEEAESQHLKAIGAQESIEAMLLEFDAPAATGGEPTGKLDPSEPRTLPPELVDIKAKAEAKRAEALALAGRMRGAAGGPLLPPTPPDSDEAGGKGKEGLS